MYYFSCTTLLSVAVVAVLSFLSLLHIPFSARVKINDTTAENLLLFSFLSQHPQTVIGVSVVSVSREPMYCAHLSSTNIY